MWSDETKQENGIFLMNFEVKKNETIFLKDLRRICDAESTTHNLRDNSRCKAKSKGRQLGFVPKCKTTLELLLVSIDLLVVALGNSTAASAFCTQVLADLSPLSL